LRQHRRVVHPGVQIMTGFNSKRSAAADKLQEPWNEDEWRRNNWRCQHGWLRGEQCEICNAPQPAQEPPSEWEGIKAILDEYGLQAIDFVADFKAAVAQPAQDGKCKYCVDGCAACDARAQPAQELLHIVQSNGKHSPLLTHMMSKRTTPPQPAQEPTGMLHIDRLGQWLDASLKERKRPWVGLTDGEVAELVEDVDWYNFPMDLVRASEAKLKEKNNG